MGVNSLAVRAVVGVLTMMGGIGFMGIAEGGTWCVAVSSATAKALQVALDYACGPGGADCVPIQIDGLCYLPNSLAAHASYAFNSCFQRSGQAPGSCDFAGTATTSITDPSSFSFSLFLISFDLDRPMRIWGHLEKLLLGF